MPADLDALAAACWRRIRQATGLSPIPRGENRRFLIATFAANGASSPRKTPL
jgi:hypothetical protein